jgi:electron transfer flavoprotein beta subunit
MNIIVCIKQVPSSNKVIMDPETHTIVRDGKKICCESV